MLETDPLSTLLPSLGSSGGVLFVAWLFIKGKLDGIKLLWGKMDELRDKMSENRLSDAKEYATRADVGRAIEKLELHIDKSFTVLGAKIDEMDRKLDQHRRDNP